MAKVKTKKTREEKLIEAKLRRRKKYEEIKNNPEKYAIQKEKERLRYIKRKEQKKIKSAADMTPREKRHQRKKWKENTKRYEEKKKSNRRIQQLLIDGTPPTSDHEDSVLVDLQQDPLEGPSNQVREVPNTRCKPCQKKKNLIKRLRYIHKKQIGKLKQQKEKVEKERDAIKKMLTKMIVKNRIRQAQSTPSTEQKIDRLIETVDGDKREEVKKKLLFGEIVSRNLSEGFSALKKKEKRLFSDIVMKNKDSFKKHKVLGKTDNFTVRDKKIIQKPDKLNIQQQIEDFFEDDCNTKISPEKNEFITRNGVRKQKRYLNDTLINLHKKFMNDQNSDVGYSTFCKYRPFWVLYPKESDRNTCACKVHVNFDLLVKSLNKHRIIEQTNATALLQSLCCDVYNEECLNRICEVCKIKEIRFQEFNNEDTINYYEWCTKKENYTTKWKEKTKIINTKTKIQDYPKNVIEKIQKSLKSYLRHCANIVTQYKYLKSLKATLTTKEAVVHLDFSENYSVQFNEEIQSFHFGGSRTQITLHTSVVYVIDQDTGIMKPYSACSISECNLHDARAIWAHLIPLIFYIQEISQKIDTIHFVSDSPSSQYRNRYMFYIIGQLHQEFPELKSVTWNYLEAGHGKGAPDGVGAVLKRTADQVVRMGTDIGTIEEFRRQIQGKVKNIKLLSVSEQDVKEKTFPSKVQPFRGTMSVHQVLWSSNSLRMTFRKLSCFFCENGVTCSHGYHLGFIDLPPPPDNNSVQLEDFLNKNTTGSFLREMANCLSPTIEHCSSIIPDLIQKPKPSDKVTIDATPKKHSQSKTITVLSDVRLHWTNKPFTEKSPKLRAERRQEEESKKENRECQSKTPTQKRKINTDVPKKEIAKREKNKQKKSRTTVFSNFFGGSCDESSKRIENKSRKIEKEDQFKDIHKNVNKMFDSSDEDIF